MDTQSQPVAPTHHQRSRKDKQQRSQSRPKSASRSKSPRKPANKRASVNKSTSNASTAKSPSRSKAQRPKSISKSPLSRKKRESTSSAKGAKVYTKKEMSEQQQKTSPAKRNTRSASQVSTTSPKHRGGNQTPLVSLFEDSRLKQEIEELKSSDVVPRKPKHTDMDLSDVRDYVLRKRGPPATSSTPYRATAQAACKVAHVAKEGTCRVTHCAQALWWPFWSRMNQACSWAWKRVPMPKWLVVQQQRWTRAGYLRFTRAHVWQVVMATFALVFFLWVLNLLHVSKFDPVKYAFHSVGRIMSFGGNCVKDTWHWMWSWAPWSSKPEPPQVLRVV